MLEKVRLVIILVLLCCISCKHKSTTPGDINLDLFQGDWVSNDKVISVYDTLILISYFDEYKEFYINNDTLYVEEINKSKKNTKFYIELLNQDSLVLIPISSLPKNRYFLSRLKTFSSVYDFEKVKLTSTPCEGDCPVLNISVDKAGNVVYEGIQNVAKRGLFHFKLNKSQQEYFMNKIGALNFKALDSLKASNIADNTVYQLEFYYNDEISEIKTDAVDAPPALKLLISYMINMQEIKSLANRK